MRLTKYTFVVLCSTLVGMCGLIWPNNSPAADHRYAAYYQPADDESETDEPPPPEEPTDEMPAEEMPEEDAPPAKVPTGDEPLERLGDDETPAAPAPPPPVMEDDFPVDTAPGRRPTSPLPDSTTRPQSAVVPGQSYGTPGDSAWSKGWGYNGGCCANVWDGYCGEMHGCHLCGRGHGRLWCPLKCGKSKLSGGRSKCCQRGRGSCCCQHGGQSCCRASTKVDGEDGKSPPVGPEAVPYASAARSSRPSSAVVLQHWDMPRITSRGGKKAAKKALGDRNYAPRARQ